MGLRGGSIRPAGCIGLIIAVLALAGCGGEAASTTPGPIVFSGRPDDPDSLGWQLLVVNPDGTGLRRLTRTDGDSAPSWSPDGTKVAFSRTLDTCGLPACGTIWVVEADGSNAQPLTDDSQRREAPAWSPDGDTIVFTQWDYARGSDLEIEVDIYVMSAEGGEPTRLTDLRGEESDPAWSPDGEQIVFAHERGEQADIYVMNSDGSQVRRLTDTRESEFFPDWSPAGDAIAFIRFGAYRDAIVLVNTDGSDERVLRGPSSDAPAWSPDGKQLAFTADDELAIWAMDADGGNVHKVVSGDFSEPTEIDWAAAND